MLRRIAIISILIFTILLQSTAYAYFPGFGWVEVDYSESSGQTLCDGPMEYIRVYITRNGHSDGRWRMEGYDEEEIYDPNDPYEVPDVYCTSVARVSDPQAPHQVPHYSVGEHYCEVFSDYWYDYTYADYPIGSGPMSLENGLGELEVAAARASLFGSTPISADIVVASLIDVNKWIPVLMRSEYRWIGGRFLRSVTARTSPGDDLPVVIFCGGHITVVMLNDGKVVGLFHLARPDSN